MEDTFFSFLYNKTKGLLLVNTYFFFSSSKKTKKVLFTLVLARFTA